MRASARCSLLGLAHWSGRIVARYISCTVATTYIGTWNDTGRAKETALSQIRAGADVLFPNADAVNRRLYSMGGTAKPPRIVGNAADVDDQNGV